MQGKYSFLKRDIKKHLAGNFYYPLSRNMITEFLYSFSLKIGKISFMSNSFDFLELWQIQFEFKWGKLNFLSFYFIDIIQQIADALEKVCN